MGTPHWNFQIVANEWIHATTHSMRVGMEDHLSAHTLIRSGRGEWSCHFFSRLNQETLGY
jgi:hypothetical protein